MIVSLLSDYKSLKKFSVELPDFTVLTGINGSGKTQFLSSLLNNIATCLNHDQVNLDRRTYVTGYSLSPNESYLVTREFLQSRLREAWQNYYSYQYRKKNSDPYINIRQVFSQGSYHLKGYEKVAFLLGKDIDDLSESDIYDYFPGEFLTNENSLFYQNFSNIFKRYYDRYEQNQYREFLSLKKGNIHVQYLSEEEFVKNFGEAPWDIVNKILEQSNLDYYFDNPIGLQTEEGYQIKIVSKVDKTIISFNDLSSGEKILMSLVLALYNSRFDFDFPEILLMDEVDASLHPSMTKQFLDVIENVFVKQKGIKVIIATHSPSTVALAPEDSIYIVNKVEPRISKVSKDQAVQSLLQGVPSLSLIFENRRQIFVESPFDVSYYERIYNLLKTRLNPEVSLNFISSGESRTDKNGIKVANCDQVKNIVNTLRGYGNSTVWGIIDRDTGNIDKDYIKVLGVNQRYNIENYIFDPLLVSIFLVRERIIDKKLIGLEEHENIYDIKQMAPERIQSLIDFFIESMKITMFKNPPHTDLVSSKCIGGLELQLPRWYLDFQGHELEGNILKAFSKLHAIKKNTEDALKLAIINKVMEEFRDFIPLGFLDVLLAVQAI